MKTQDEYQLYEWALLSVNSKRFDTWQHRNTTKFIVHFISELQTDTTHVSHLCSLGQNTPVVNYSSIPDSSQTETFKKMINNLNIIASFHFSPVVIYQWSIIQHTDVSPVAGCHGQLAIQPLQSDNFWRLCCIIHWVVIIIIINADCKDVSTLSQ